ncbi:hypothetical protein PFICI_07136 [Pestalotiopsis fici W106-1]|uniref:Protein kinase domain-containing protein n=1 Tax=Pestalotiopsis fici (strain W106-1 / CGMCC3.15140) TaxID=1229662 RepID=W3X7X6_PESFW|nr:uncharacterized protein PFICI_07136 [Pestalotiopsis fici W106-1]ETS82134.1 hypothetical protein PFICI_07136 [Pestalotiopsis fici W106-1]
MFNLEAFDEEARPRAKEISFQGRTFESFGYYLHETNDKEAKEKKQEWLDIDPSLRSLVAHCLALEPKDRPTVGELQIAVMNGLATANLAPNARNPKPNYADDQEIQQLIRKLFYEVDAMSDPLAGWFAPPETPVTDETQYWDAGIDYDAAWSGNQYLG